MEPPVSPKDSLRFMKKVVKDVATGCWNWTGAINKDGYGELWFNKKTRLAHRFFYIWKVLPVDDRGYINHSCNNRRCCNPDHLRNVPPVLVRLKEFCKRGHKFPLKQNKKRRVCNICKRITNHNRYLSLKKYYPTLRHNSLHSNAPVLLSKD